MQNGRESVGAWGGSQRKDKDSVEGFCFAVQEGGGRRKELSFAMRVTCQDGMAFGFVRSRLIFLYDMGREKDASGGGAEGRKAEGTFFAFSLPFFYFLGRRGVEDGRSKMGSNSSFLYLFFFLVRERMGKKF